MTYFDEETMPMDSTEHDTDNPTIDATETATMDENALEEAILKAEEFATENETMLLQEGDGDFEEEIKKDEKSKKQGRKAKKKLEPSEESLLDEAEPDPFYEEPSPQENLPENLDNIFEDELNGKSESSSNESNNIDSETLIQRPKRPSENVRFYIDEDGKYVEDVSSPHRAQHQRLSSAFNRRDLLSGYVEGFELNSAEMPRVFLYAGDIKVVIPVSHLDLPLTEENRKDPLETRLAVNAILGAKIFYMILDINFPAKVAVASRTYANERRRGANLNYKSNGVYKIRSGVLCTAQVMHVAERFVRIDIYGFETTIGIGQISNLWVNDIREILDVGSEVMVELVTVERNPNSGAVTGIEASVKLAEQQSAVKLDQNMTYTGTVSGFSSAAYFVHVAGVEKTVRCPINKCYTGKLIEVGDYVKFFVDTLGTGQYSGSILKILKKTEKSLLDF